MRGRKILPMEGESLVPVFKGKTWERKGNLFWEHEGNRAVRSGNWKLVSKYPENKWALYNMEEDRSEMNDMGTIHPEKIAEMETLYNKWAERAGVVDWNRILNRD